MESEVACGGGTSPVRGSGRDHGDFGADNGERMRQQATTVRTFLFGSEASGAIIIRQCLSER